MMGKEGIYWFLLWLATIGISFLYKKEFSRTLFIEGLIIGTIVYFIWMR